MIDVKKWMPLGILLLFLIVLGVHRLQFIAEVANRPSHSFVNYYTASVLLARGADVSQYYVDAWYMAQTVKFTPGIEDIYTPHPPTMALLLLPLTHQTHADARIIWIYVNVVIVICAVAWILWKERFSPGWTMIAIIFVLLYQPLTANFEYGQVYGVLFAGFTVIGYGFRQYADTLAGVGLGLIFIIKVAGWVLFPLSILMRRWKILLWSGSTIGIVSLLSLPIVGLQSWQTFLSILPAYSRRPSFAVTAYQSISGFFKHHFFYHPLWSPSPLIELPALGSLLSVMMVLILFLITFWRGRNQQQLMLTYGAVIILSVVISPASLDYHYTILLLPILLLLSRFQSMSLPQRIVFIVGAFLLSVDYPYQSDVYRDTFLSLTAYPKLIGGLLLWGLTISLREATLQQNSHYPIQIEVKNVR